MPSLPSWLPGTPNSAPVPGSTLTASRTATGVYQYNRDPNAPDHRLQISAKCIYERELPGGSYITAHIERLQSGYYDSPTVHEDLIGNVRFLAIRFVFHEASTERRFKSAKIRISVHDANLKPKDIIPLPPQLNHPADDESLKERPRRKPRFLRHAPHLLYGAMSPETLDWNFNLAGSLGVSQTPVSASINPSGGWKSSYKVYKMMKIQGSVRTNSSWFGKHYDIEDGELYWTLEENELQKSGLPREFTFAMMLTKGDPLNDVRFEIAVEPDVASWFGRYPQWWVHLLKYQPLNKDPLDLDEEVGQRFEPSDPILGFNFAGLMSTFDDFVSLPGTLYSTHDWTTTQAPSATANQGSNQSKPQQQQQQPQRQLTQSPAQVDNSNQGNPGNTVHLRIHLDPSHEPGHTPSTTALPYPDGGYRSQRRSLSMTAVPQSQSASSRATVDLKTDTNHQRTTSKSTKADRRVSINGAISSTPSKYKVPRIIPLKTHYEEKQGTKLGKAKSTTSEEEPDRDDAISVPETASDTNKPVSTPGPLSSGHRPSKSTPVALSSTGKFSNKPVLFASGEKDPAATVNAPLSSHHSLRRTRSRSGLRTASLHSQPEDEEAISAAMDMLTGSPPPPAPSPLLMSSTRPSLPPQSFPSASMIPSDEIVLATPRTRAALADLIDIERAESARIERRNGDSGSHVNRPPRDLSAGRHIHGSTMNTDISTRPSERDIIRERRRSMPVTSTGVGYTAATMGPSSAFLTRDNSSDRSGEGESGRVGILTRGNYGKNNLPAGSTNGNRRSSLMIPIGARRGGYGGNNNEPVDSNIGKGIGVTDGSTLYGPATTSAATARSGSFRKREGNSGVYSGYEYVD